MFNQTGVSGIKNRANSARMFAWSSLWEEWYRIEHTPGIAAKERQARQTALMKNELRKRLPSHRVVKLVSLLKMIKAKGEKFIIISDRLFLLNLGAQVTSSSFYLTLGVFTDGIESGIVDGNVHPWRKGNGK